MTPTFILGAQKQHSWHVQLVLKCLHHNNLFAKLEKCKCDQTVVEFVGYEIALGDELGNILHEIAAVVGWGICEGYCVCGSESSDKFHTHLPKMQRSQWDNQSLESSLTTPSA